MDYIVPIVLVSVVILLVLFMSWRLTRGKERELRKYDFQKEWDQEWSDWNHLPQG